MDKERFGTLAAELGFDFQDGAAWGERGGRRFALALSPEGSVALRAAVDASDEAKRLSLESWLAEAKAAGRCLGWSDASGSITAVLPAAGLEWAGIEGFIDELAARLSELGLAEACWSCNEARETAPALSGPAAWWLCGDCYGKIEAASNAAKDARRIDAGRVAVGFLGALAGGLAGSVLWVLIGIAGFYASFAGLAIAWAAVKGYGLVKGKPNAATPWIIGASILVSMVAAEATGIAIQIVRAGREQGVPVGALDGFRLLPLFLTDSGIAGEAIKNLLLGLLFAGLGSWRIVRELAASAKTPVVEIRRP